MYKLYIMRLTLTFCALFSLCVFVSFIQQTPAAHAAASQLSFTSPSVNGQAVGHVGTNVTITASGFSPVSTNLYTTTSNNSANCADGASGLVAFTPSSITPAQDGTFTIQTTWPSSAATANTAYYLCAVSAAGGVLSSNTFTVAPAVTITVAPSVVAPGGQVTITGANWLPPQQLNVSIVVGDSGAPPLVFSTPISDQQGNFTTTLPIPANANPQAYAVRVYAVNEQTPAMILVQANAVTVTGLTPTPTITATATVTPTASPSPTVTVGATPTGTTMPTDSNTGGGGSNSGMTLLLFAMGGLGIILVLVGAILFVVYLRK